MSLRALEIDVDVDDPLPEHVRKWIDASQERLNEYWDQFAKKPHPQYIECDFRLVSVALAKCIERDWIDGRLFVEWGCGFGVVTGVAALLGLDAVGIEVEPFLCEEAVKLFEKQNVTAEVWQGNFLPSGARRMAEDEDPLVSLSHNNSPAYDEHGMSIEDFAIIFAYPWPGEEHFLRAVFDKYARTGALLLMYRGPFHVELYRKA